MNNRTITVLIVNLALCGFWHVASAQMPAPSEEHNLLKKEVGNWNATTKVYFGPAGPVEEPSVSKATEVNKMIGGFWVTSDFKGNFGGAPFVGHGVFGYDPAAKKYTGMWIDSFAPHGTKMLGDYDKATKTMTFETTGVGMDGKPSKGRNVVVYHSDDKRTMTMYMTMPGQTEMTKVMVVDYERAAEKE